MSNNKDLDNYLNKYQKSNHTLLKFTKKEVEDFAKKNQSEKASLLDGKKWKLIGDTYYEIPRVLSLTWFRNLHKGYKIGAYVLLGGLVTAVTVPTVLAIENSKNRHIVKDITFTTVEKSIKGKGHFFSKNPNVLYIPVIDYNEYVTKSLMRVLDVDEDYVELKNLLSCDPEKKATFNMKTGEIYYPSYSFFADTSNIYGPTLPHQEIFYDKEYNIDAGSKIIKDGHPYFINLNDYDLQPIKDNGVYYIPLDVMMLIDPTIATTTAYCSNDKVQYLDPNMPVVVDLISEYPSSFYKWSYDLFTLNVDLNFGLTGYRRYQRNNDTYFTYNKEGARKTFEPYKEKLINSKNTLEFDITMNKMIDEQLDDGGHTGIFFASAGTDVDTLPTDFGMTKDYKYALDLANAESEKRKNAPESEQMGKDSAYCCTFNGKDENDIGYLCINVFDSMAFTTLKTANSQFNKKRNPDSKIQDVVIDIANCGGGNTGVEGAILSWICGGTATQLMKDARDDSVTKSVFKYDLSGDKKFGEETDYLPNDVNVYILTDRTFSAASALAFDTYMYTLSDEYKTTNKKNIKFIGKPHLGGACSVTDIILSPTGLGYRLSSSAVGINWNDSSITCDEKGYIDSGWELTADEIVNRTGVINKKIVEARK